MKKNKLVVLGHTGLLGSLIYRNFKNKKRKVKGYSSNICDFRKFKSFQFSVKSSFKNSSIIFSAGKHRKYGSTKNLYLENIKIIKNLIKLCKKNKPSKIIFLSTVEVYKPKKLEHITENTKTKPINLYAKGKLYQENLLIKFCKINQIKLLILRLPGFYGPQDNNLSIISKLIFCCLNKKKFPKMTSGQEKRDYVYINDIVEIIYLLEKTNFNIDVLNIVKGSSNSINDIIEKIDRIFSKKIKFKKIQTKKNFNLNFNNYRLKKYLRDFQFVGLEQGVKKYKKIIRI